MSDEPTLLSHYMKLAGITTASELERRTGVANQMIDRFLKNKRPITATMAGRLARALNISPDDLRPNSFMRSHTKRDAMSRIDSMNDNQVAQIIPVLDKIAELVKKTEPDDDPEGADGPTKHKGVILRSVR